MHRVASLRLWWTQMQASPKEAFKSWCIYCGRQTAVKLQNFIAQWKLSCLVDGLLMYTIVTWTKENRENNKSSSHAGRNKSTHLQYSIRSHFLDIKLLLFQIKLDSIAKNKCRPSDIFLLLFIERIISLCELWYKK